VPILLQKSVTADRLLTTGFDLPALTLVTQLQRYAIHGAIAGGTSAINLRLVRWSLWMPDVYLRSIEPLIVIVLGCMRWKGA
jgi:hypothetical protein